MIPTKQTILHDPDNGKHGNCFSAVLASLLHLPIEDVPLFTDPKRWQRDLNAWLRQFGLGYIQIGDAENWLAEVGIEGAYHEMCGYTLRSNETLHAVVAIDGKQVFDPHPDNTGLADGAKCYGLFIALTPWRAREDSNEIPETVSVDRGLNDEGLQSNHQGSEQQDFDGDQRGRRRTWS